MQVWVTRLSKLSIGMSNDCVCFSPPYMSRYTVPHICTFFFFNLSTVLSFIFAPNNSLVSILPFFSCSSPYTITLFLFSCLLQCLFTIGSYVFILSHLNQCLFSGVFYLVLLPCCLVLWRNFHNSMSSFLLSTIFNWLFCVRVHCLQAPFNIRNKPSFCSDKQARANTT